MSKWLSNLALLLGDRHNHPSLVEIAAVGQLQETARALLSRLARLPSPRMFLLQGRPDTRQHLAPASAQRTRYA